MHLPPVKIWLIESFNFRQHQLGSIDAGCQADSADYTVEDGQRYTMRAHELQCYPQFIVVCEF
jgi:hypothetical protein